MTLSWQLKLVFQPFRLRWANTTAKEETGNTPQDTDFLWGLPFFLSLSLFYSSSLLSQSLAVAWVSSFVCVCVKTWLALIRRAGTQGDAETHMHTNTLKSMPLHFEALKYLLQLNTNLHGAQAWPLITALRLAFWTWCCWIMGIVGKVDKDFDSRLYSFDCWFHLPVTLCQNEVYHLK